MKRRPHLCPLLDCSVHTHTQGRRQGSHLILLPPCARGEGATGKHQGKECGAAPRTGAEELDAGEEGGRGRPCSAHGAKGQTACVETQAGPGAWPGHCCPSFGPTQSLTKDYSKALTQQEWKETLPGFEIESLTRLPERKSFIPCHMTGEFELLNPKEEGG